MSPPTLIETVADLTADRDRDSLEASLAQLLLAQLDADSVAYLRLVPVEDGTRLWPVLRATREGSARPEPFSDVRRLPVLDGSRRRCVEERAALRLSVPDAPRCTYLFPVMAETEPVALVEAEGVPSALEPERRAAVANLLRIYRNHLALLDYGEHDMLTGLRNRRTFNADITRMLDDAPLPAYCDGDARASPPPDAPHWLAVVDVDRFKRINDDFGHLYGDEVLLLLSQMMRTQFRPVDRLYRFGGEEFVILLARTPVDAAHAPLERLRAAVEARVFSQVGRVTVSIGYTRLGPLDDSVVAFDRADAALYWCKQNGRNQVRSWESLVADGHLQARTAQPADDAIEMF